MSQGNPIPLPLAQDAAQHLLEMLAPACTRIAIAGSIRRRKPSVADIELVAMPTVEWRPSDDLWGTLAPVNLLTGPAGRLAQLLGAGEVALRQVEVHRASGAVETQTRQGEAYQALMYAGLPVDLFMVHDPDSWGVIYGLRTGPGDWNTRLVTDAHRYLRRMSEGKVYRAGQLVPCPEEEDFFRAMGQPWVDPWERSVAKVAIQAAL